MNEQTRAIRRAVKASRASLSRSERTYAALALARQCRNTRTFRQARHIGAYWAFKGEMSVMPLIEMAWAFKKATYLPVVDKDDQLTFRPFNRHTRCIKNKFGILEPAPCNAKMPVRKLDLVLVPLVAFDTNCQRIGMGGGYYDRTFADKIGHRGCKPTLWGISYAWQRQDHIKPEPWDVSMDWIFTDREQYKRTNE